MSQHVTADTLITDAIENYPVLMELFLEYGLHCVGCHIAAFETIGEGCMGHGMDEETIQMLIRDANTLIDEQK